MNIRSKQLAAASMEVFVAEAGPDYARLKAQLNGELGSTALQSAGDRITEHQANTELVRVATQHLPQVETHVFETGYKGGNNCNSSPFVTDGQGQAKFLQHNVIWFHNNYLRSKLPFYLVGQKAIDRKETALLLSMALQDDEYRDRNMLDPLMVLIYKTKDIKAYEKAKQKQLGTPYTPQELESAYLYNPETGKFLIDQKSPGSWSATSISTEFRSGKVRKGLSDGEMAAYDVIGSLTKIATMLDATDGVQGVISA